MIDDLSLNKLWCFEYISKIYLREYHLHWLGCAFQTYLLLPHRFRLTNVRFPSAFHLCSILEFTANPSSRLSAIQIDHYYPANFPTRLFSDFATYLGKLLQLPHNLPLSHHLLLASTNYHLVRTNLFALSYQLSVIKILS